MSLKAVYIVDDLEVAKVLVDPMRRAILNLLREKPMTQAQLASELGLSDASLNYHVKILRANRLVAITKKVAEGHGIIQKFFSPAAYLFVYDLDALPKNLARYFYPVSLERAWAAASLLMMEGRPARSGDRPGAINDMAAKLSALIVDAARPYARKQASYGDEGIVYEVYTKAFAMLLKKELAQGSSVNKR
jgi:DNA-binding transcriptional ArsR family regulator